MNKKRTTEDDLRYRKHRLTLSNQRIVEMAYLAKDVIDSLIGKKLTMEAANCYTSCFYTCRRLLKAIDRKYLGKHKDLVEFYKEGRGLANDWDVLAWDPEVKKR
jgi:hypothetical protein